MMINVQKNWKRGAWGVGSTSYQKRMDVFWLFVREDGEEQQGDRKYETEFESQERYQRKLISSSQGIGKSFQFCCRSNRK